MYAPCPLTRNVILLCLVFFGDCFNVMMGEVFETMALYVEHNLDGFCVCVCVLYSCRSFIDSSSFFFCYTTTT